MVTGDLRVQTRNFICKINHKKLKRAVSPILATILLIGLAIAAGSVLFIVFLPMITPPAGSVDTGGQDLPIGDGLSISESGSSVSRWLWLL